MRGAVAESLDEDGILAVNAYSLADGVLTCTTRRFHGESEFPTYEVTGRDSVHGTLLRRTTRLTAGGTVVADEQSVYDDQNRLRSTTYLDGTSITNAYSCCRLLWTRDREGRQVLRSAQTGTDHLYHAMEDVWLADVSTNGSFRVTQHFFDALGRETNTVVYAGTTPGEAQSPATVAHSPLSILHSSYPHPGSDCVERTDERGAVTRTVRSILNNAEETVETVRTNGVEVLRTVNRTFLGGGSLLRREWTRGVDNPHAEFAEDAEFTSYLPDGRRVETSVTTSSDCGTVTNSVSTYDLLGRIVSEATPLGTTAYAYDGATGRIAQTVFTSGGVLTTTAHLYNDLGEAVGTAAFGVTNRNDVTYETDASNVTWRVMTQRTFCGSMTNALTSIRERLTGLGAECRSCVETREISGRWTRLTSSFNPATSIKTETVAFSDAATNVRQSAHGIVLSTETSGTTVANVHDALGRIVATTRTIGESATVPHQSFDYAPCGDLLATHTYTNDTEYVTETYTYDALGQRVSTTGALGNAVYRSYDPLGNVVAEWGATYPVRHTYDTAGRRTSLSTTRDDCITWDTTTWAYDPATGLCTSKTYADGSTITYTYTPDGLPLRTTYASGAWIENEYDDRRNRIQTSRSDGSSDCFAYDEFSCETAMSNAAVSVRYLRDGRGHVTNETASVGSQTRNVEREYDGAGRLSLRDGIRFAYAADGQLASVSNEDFRVVYRYSDDRLDAGYDVFLTNGTVISRTVERDGYCRSLATNIACVVNGIVVETLAYTYDAVGRPVTRNMDSFGYNARGEVVSTTIGESASVYGYDGIGNSTNHPANSLNQYTTLPYELDGNMVSNGVFGYIYDAASRLKTVASNGVTIATYAYDPMSRRVRKTTAEADHYYFYDGWNLVEERVIGTNGTASVIHYVWGKDVSGTFQGAGGIGGLLVVDMNGAHYFPTYDNNGNVTRYLDASGATVAAYAYDAFGNHLSASGPMADAFFHRFSTKYFDPETGLHYYGYRFYAPMLGRWINRDPIEEEGGENLYAFCDNGYLYRIDYLGNAYICDCLRNAALRWSQKRFHLDIERSYQDSIIVNAWRRCYDRVAPKSVLLGVETALSRLGVQGVSASIGDDIKANVSDNILCKLKKLGHTLSSVTTVSAGSAMRVLLSEPWELKIYSTGNKHYQAAVGYRTESTEHVWDALVFFSSKFGFVHGRPNSYNAERYVGRVYIDNEAKRAINQYSPFFQESVF